MREGESDGAIAALAHISSATRCVTPGKFTLQKTGEIARLGILKHGLEHAHLNAMGMGFNLAGMSGR